MIHVSKKVNAKQFLCYKLKKMVVSKGAEIRK